jgi:tetratricopeptide (TPR) repeat protein
MKKEESVLQTEENNPEQVAEGYQTLFRSLMSDLKQERGGFLSMNEVKPYLLSFENPFPNTPISIFPSNEIRRQYIDTAFSIFNQRKYMEAKGCFLFLLEVTSNDPNIMLGYGTCLLLEGNQEQAKEFFEKAEALMPDNIQATVLKLRSYMDLGMEPAAQAAYRSALDDAHRQSDDERQLLLEMIGQRFGFPLVRR